MARRVLAGGALGLGLLFGFGGPSTTLGQTVELRGTAIGGAEIFQTFLKRGPGDLRSDQHAEGENSRIEVHGVIDGSAEPSEPAPMRSKPRSGKFQLMPGSGSAAQPTASPTARTQDRAGTGEQHAASAPERSTATASNEQLAGGHLIVRRDGENGWRALGLTQDGEKARRASKLLQSQGIEAAVFQFHASHGGKTVLSGYADSRSWVWPSDGCYRLYSRPAVNMIAVAKPVATRCGTRCGGHGYAPRVSSAYGAAARATSVQSYGYARSKATAVVHSGHAANAYAESSYHALGARAVAVAETGYVLP